MNFTDLNRAARIVAAKAPALLRRDAYQEAWLRFLRYGPLTFGGAYLIGRHAMLDLLRRERKQLHAELIDVAQETDAPDGLIAELRRLCPEETEALLVYYGAPRHTGRERVEAFRLRRVIKKRLAKGRSPASGGR